MPEKSPEQAFAGNKPPVTYHTIAEQIRAMQPRALTSDQYPDVILMLEYLQAETVKTYDAGVALQRELSAREMALHKREQDLALRARAVEAVLKLNKPRRYFWR